jgi:ParB family chromosome partitioning protein
MEGTVTNSMAAKVKNIRDIADGNSNIWKVPPHEIRMKPGWNVRDEDTDLEAHIESIAVSILANGFFQDKPLTVYQDSGEWYVSDGHCRLRGVLLAIERGAPIKSIPVVVEARGTDEAARIAAMLNRNAGKNLTPLEQSRVFMRLQAFSWSDEDIAKTCGRSIAYVRSIFDLAAAAPETKEAVKSGAVAATTAARAVREHGPEKARRVVAAAVKTAKASGVSKATARAVDTAAGKAEPVTRADMKLAGKVLEMFLHSARWRAMKEDEIGCSLEELEELVAKFKGKV